MEKHKAQVGDMVQPDQWNFPEKLQKDDGFKDSEFPGCEFRLPSYTGKYLLAVNVIVTGKPHYVRGAMKHPWFKSRCRIEFVGDGEPSQFSGGWIYHG